MVHKWIMLLLKKVIIMYVQRCRQQLLKVTQSVQRVKAQPSQHYFNNKKNYAA